jgi:hypothetical protein
MRRHISVTRRYIEFLFSHEEKVMGAVYDAVVRDIWVNGPPVLRAMPLDTELQLPTTDDDKVGQDVE